MTSIRFVQLVFLVFFFSACNPDDGDSGPKYNGTPNAFDLSTEFGSPVSRDFIGQVADVENNAIKNASVKIGTTTVQTDDNGMFVINDASVYERFGAIQVTKTGYYPASRSVVPGTGKNLVRITLVAAEPIAIITSGSRTAVALDSGTQLIFEGDYVDQDGAPHSGNVRVAAYELQPNSFLATQMPGMLYGVDENGDASVMNTYGMVNVELRDSSNQGLELKEGSTAEITVQIPNSLISSAPQTVPMWYFDQQVGYWRQEGTASKKGGAYVGVVKHFTCWNFGEPFVPVLVSGAVSTSSGDPLQNTLLLASNSSGNVLNAPGTVITDSNGGFRTMVAAGNTFNYSTVAFCPGAVASFPMGPYTQDTVLNTPLLSNGTAVSVEGTAVNCNATAIEAGYVLISNGTQSTFGAISSGNFSFSVPECTAGDDLVLDATDFENEITTGPIKYLVADASVAAGALQLCASSGFVSFKIDNDPVVYSSDVFATLTLNDATFNVFIRGDQPGEGTIFSLYGLTTTGGTFDTETIQLSLSDGSDSFQINQNGPNSVVFKFANYSAVGEYVDITFSGTFEQSGITHNVSGTVHVRRSF